jgi:hypothetical protein
MGFLSPWFLAGVALVGLPVWLHLLKRHKVDPTPFPSLMYFEHREQSSVQHRRLDYILLFILRTAMLILLALLFASPYVNVTTPKGRGEKIVVVAVDRSFSMRTREGRGTRLDQAKAEAQSILARLPAGTTAQVIALAGTTQAMTQQTADPAELRAAIPAIQQSDSRTSYGELARYLRTLYESTKKPIEAHLVSDLQRTGMPPGFTDLRLDPDTSLRLHAVGSDVPNYAVETVNAPRRVYDPKKVRIQATLAGYGTPSATRTVTLVLNGKTVQSKTVEIPEGARATVEFLGLDASYGFNRGEIRLEATDALAADNSFYFSVERTDPRKVLFVDDGRKRGALYFRTALNASPDAAFQLEAQRPESAAAANLSSYALVVLSDPGTLPGGLEDALRRWVREGGSALVALGPASAVLPRVPLLDEPIEASRYATRETVRFLTAADLDSGHSVLKWVERFEGVKFYQAISVKPANSRVLAKLNDETPLILERQIGEGRVMAITSHFDNVVNDLPLHNSWVPFVQKSAEYLGGGGVDQPVNLAVDQYVELRTGEGGGSAEVSDPDGRRVLTLEEAAKARNFGLNREGFFEVRAANGRRSLVAAHADRKESDLTVIPKETQELWAAGGVPGGGAGGAGQAGEGLTKPESLAPYILLLLLGVVLAQSAIANRYLRPAGEVRSGAKGAA